MEYLLVLIVLPLCCLSIPHTSFELSNDPDYPQLLVFSDVSYNIVANQYVALNCTIIIHEEIDDSANVCIAVNICIISLLV